MRNKDGGQQSRDDGLLVPTYKKEGFDLKKKMLPQRLKHRARILE